MKTIKDLLQDEITRNGKAVSIFENRRDLALTKKAHSIFAGLINDTTEIEASRDRITFKARREEENYSREIFEIRLDRDFRTEEIKDIKLSAYSTNDSSDYELRRLIQLGTIANFLYSGGKKSIFEYDALGKSLAPMINEIYSSIWNLEKQRDQITIEEIQAEKDAFLAKAEKGLHFNYGNTENWNRPGLEVNNGRRITNVSSLKIVSRTASGKSTTVEVTYPSHRWNHDAQETEGYVHTETLKNIRTTNIDGFLNQVKKFVK